MEREYLTNDEIKEKFNNLISDKSISPQKRGFEFEKLITSKLHNEGLEPKASYKPKGEQIDGSFFWNGSTFLLEAKWVKDKIPASTIYSFKGKVDGKFHTTSGVYVSVNGYSEDSIPTVMTGKTLNLLFFDSEDIDLIFNSKASFTQVLKYKIRQAGDTGNVNALFKETNQTNKPKTSDGIEILIFVEGVDDINRVNFLITNLKFSRKFSYKIVSLNGYDNLRKIPTLLNLYGENNFIKTSLAILDVDFKRTNAYKDLDELRKIIINSSLSIDTKFFFLNSQIKQAIRSKNLNLNNRSQNETYSRIQEYVNQILEEYDYDIVVDLPNDTLIRTMSVAKWDYENSKIIFVDDTDEEIEISNTNELVSYLNEILISTMDANMPLSWLKEQSYLNYEDEAKEHILNYHKKEITNLKWTLDI